nr:putative bola-like protein c8c9.11 [Quercus suber]
MSARTDAEAAQNQASSGITPATLTSVLQNKLGASHVDIADLSGAWGDDNARLDDCSALQKGTTADRVGRSGGCGQMYEAVIVSPQFAKKTTLARHRLVNGALKEEIAAIHAWTPKCFTPEEWEKKQGQST